jgi:hypothetical protein
MTKFPIPVNETLREKQWRFVRMKCHLVAEAERLGYQLTDGDAFRDPRSHGKFGEKGVYGERFSCHKLRLAQDYNLFLGGKWLDKTPDFEPLGAFWKTLSDDARWGGDWQDGNHFSLEHEGHK